MYLQRVIEHITGESFAPYLRRTLLDPLGIKNGSFSWHNGFSALSAVGHNGEERGDAVAQVVSQGQYRIFFLLLAHRIRAVSDRDDEG